MQRFKYDVAITYIGNMSELPDWVKKHKKKGIAIECRNGRYYATRVTSVWDPVKKRARKVTLEYLGVVTPEGIIPPKHKRFSGVECIKEAGNIAFLRYFSDDVVEHLKKYWPDEWESLLSLAILKLAYGECLKRMQFRYETSMASEYWPNAHLSKNTLSSLLERVGSSWGLQRRFFKSLSEIESYLAIDLTQVFSYSENINWLESGYNSRDLYMSQLNLLLLWGMNTHVPMFMKLLPGSIHSAKTIVNALYESDLRNVILVADKGFYSNDNVEVLERHNVNYILALKRDLSFVNYPSMDEYKKYFFYRDSVEWYHEYKWKGRRIIIYLDKKMSAEEEGNFLRRCAAKGKSQKRKYEMLKDRFGTLALLTDLGETAEKIYKLYKQRREIEYAFRSMKTTLEADKTYMQSREKLQGYFFIIFLALYIYSKVIDHLKRKDIIDKYSVNDILTQLAKIYIIKLKNKNIITSEIPKKTMELIKLIEIPITKILGR